MKTETVKVLLTVPAELHYKIAQAVLTQKQYGSKDATIHNMYVEAVKKAVSK